MKTKADITYHSDGFRDRKPAVNVKSYKTWQQGYDEFVKDEEVDPEFTKEWIEEHVSEDAMQDYWQFAIENSWEILEDDTREIYGQHVKVYSEGRSGGWAYVEGIDWDVDSWDAIEFGRWKRFAKYARAFADDVMRYMIELIYINTFDSWIDERSELRAPDIERAYVLHRGKVVQEWNS